MKQEGLRREKKLIYKIMKVTSKHLFVLSIAVPLFFSCAASGKKTSIDDTTKMKDLPTGIVRAINFSYRPTLPDNYFDENPWVQGIVVRERWADLEPSENQIDWTYLDQMVAYGKKVKRPVIFLFLTAGNEGENAKPNIPEWLAGSANGYNRVLADIILPSGGASTCVVPWDNVIMEKWMKTARKIANRYDNNQTLAGVYLTGVQARYPEMLIPNTSVYLNPDKFPNEGVKSINDPQNIPLDLPEAKVYSDAWARMIDSMAVYFKSTWIINLVDKFNLPGYPNISAPMLSIAEKSDAMSNRVTIGTANLGYNTVIKPTNGMIDEKFQLISSANRMAPIVYELGPRKQDKNGVDGQVYQSLKYAKEKIGCRFVIVWGGTPNGTFGIERFENELKQASKDFWNK